MSLFRTGHWNRRFYGMEYASSFRHIHHSSLFNPEGEWQPESWIIFSVRVEDVGEIGDIGMETECTGVLGVEHVAAVVS